jgi:hypothetical protein
MIGRRRILMARTVVATGVTSVAPTLLVPRGNALTFRMVQHKSEIGTHASTFVHKGDPLSLQIATDIGVALLSIPIARYRYRGVEIWKGNSLAEATEDINKSNHQRINAHRIDEGVVALGSQTKRSVAPPYAIPTSYWNTRMLDGPTTSPEDSPVLAPRVVDLRMERAQLAAGRVIAADHYSLNCPFTTDLWYDETPPWAWISLGVVHGSDGRDDRL